MASERTTDGPLYYGAPEDYTDEVMQRMVYVDGPLPPDLPEPPEANEPVFVNMSIRMPVDVVERLRAVADSRGEKFTSLARKWIELELANAESGTTPSRDDALRAVEAIRKVLGSADAA